ncbi:hypothetical protein BC937DRAFT_92213, partial [Endogone sp. FLAS-F59071]
EEEEEEEEYDDEDTAFYGDQEELNEQIAEASHHHPIANFVSDTFDFAAPPRRQMDVVDYGQGAEWDDTEEGMVEEDGVDEEEYEVRSYVEEDEVAVVLSDDDTADKAYNVIPHEVAPVVLDLMSSDDEAHQEDAGEFQQGAIEGTYNKEGLEFRSLDGNMQQLAEDHRVSIDNLLNWNFDESQQDGTDIVYEHLGGVPVDEQEVHHQSDSKLPEEEVAGLVEENVTGLAKEEGIDPAKEEVVGLAETAAPITSLVKDQSSQLSLAELHPPDPPTTTTAITMTVPATPTRVSIPALFSPNRPIPTFPGLSSASVQFDWGTPPRGFGGLLSAGEVATAASTTIVMATTADDDESPDSKHGETTPTPQPPFHEDLRDMDAAMLTPPPQRARHVGSPLSFEAVAFVGRGEGDVEVEAEVAKRARNTEDERPIELGVDLSDVDERVEGVQGAESSEESQAELERVLFVLDDDSEDIDVNEEQAPVDLVQIKGGDWTPQEPAQDIRSEPATAMVHSIAALQREVVPAANQNSLFDNDSLIPPTMGPRPLTQELNPPAPLGSRHDSKLSEWSPQSQPGVVAARVKAYEVAGATTSAAAATRAQVERHRSHRYTVEQEAISEEEEEAEAREQTDIIAAAEQQQRPRRRSMRTARGNSVGAEVSEDTATIANSGDDSESQQRSLRLKGPNKDDPATFRTPRRGARRGVGERTMTSNRIARAMKGQGRRMSPVAEGATKEAVAGSESDDENEEQKGVEQRREYSLRMRETRKKEEVEGGSAEKRRRRRKSSEKGGEQVRGLNEKDAEDGEASDASSAGSYDLRERHVHKLTNEEMHALGGRHRRDMRMKEGATTATGPAQYEPDEDAEKSEASSVGSYDLRERHVHKLTSEEIRALGGKHRRPDMRTKEEAATAQNELEDAGTSDVSSAGSYDLRERHVHKLTGEEMHASTSRRRRSSRTAKNTEQDIEKGQENSKDSDVSSTRNYDLRTRHVHKIGDKEMHMSERRRRSRRVRVADEGEEAHGTEEKEDESEDESDASRGSYDLRGRHIKKHELVELSLSNKLTRSKSIGAMETAEPAQEVSIHSEENHHVKNHALEEPSSSRRRTRSKFAGADAMITAETAQEVSLDQVDDSDTSQGSYDLRDRYIKKHDLEAQHSPRKRTPLASTGIVNVAAGAETKQDDAPLSSQEEDSDASRGSYDLRDRHIKKHELETTHSSPRRRERLISSVNVASAAIGVEMIIEEDNQDSENTEEEKAGAGRWLRRRSVAAKDENTGGSEDGVVMEQPGYGLRSRRPPSQSVQTEQVKEGEPRKKGRAVLRLRRYDDQQVGGDGVLDERERYGLRVRRVSDKIGVTDKAERPEQIQENEQDETEADDSVALAVIPVVEDEAEVLSGKRKRRRSKRVVDRDGKYKVQEDTESTGDEEKGSRKRNGRVGRSKRGEDQLALSAMDVVTGGETETNELVADGAGNEVHHLEEQQDENAAPANKRQTRKRSRNSLTKTDGAFAPGIEEEDSISDEGMEWARRGKRASHGKGKASATSVARDRGHGRGRTRGRGSLMTSENGRSRRSAKTLDSTLANASLSEFDAGTPIHEPDHENLASLNALNDDELAALFRNHDCSSDAQHEALYNQLNESIQIRSKSGTPVPVGQDTPVPVPVGQDTPVPVPVGQDTPVPVGQDTPVPVRQGTPVPVRQDTEDLENAGNFDAPENTELTWPLPLDIMSSSDYPEHLNADTKVNTADVPEITAELGDTNNALMTTMSELHDKGDTTIQEPEQQTPRPRQPRSPIRSNYALRSKCPLRQFILSRASTKEYYISKSCLIEGPSPWLPRKRKESEAFRQNGEDTPRTPVAGSSGTAEQGEGEGEGDMFIPTLNDGDEKTYKVLSRVRPDFLRSAKKIKSSPKRESKGQGVDEKVEVEVEVEVEIVKDRGEGKGKATATDN